MTILSSPATRKNRIEHGTTKNTMRAAVRGLSMLALPWRTVAEPEGSTAALPWTNPTTRGEGKAPALHTTPAVDVASQGRFLLHDIRVCPLFGDIRFMRFLERPAAINVYVLVNSAFFYPRDAVFSPKIFFFCSGLSEGVTGTGMSYHYTTASDSVTHDATRTNQRRFLLYCICRDKTETISVVPCVCVLHIKPFFYSSTSSTPSVRVEKHDYKQVIPKDGLPAAHIRAKQHILDYLISSAALLRDIFL